MNLRWRSKPLHVFPSFIAVIKSAIVIPCISPSNISAVIVSRVIGFIPTVAEPFCQNCDRVRIKTDGKLYACLFDKSRYSLKSLLEEGKNSDDEIIKYITPCRKNPKELSKLSEPNH